MFSDPDIPLITDTHTHKRNSLTIHYRVLHYCIAIQDLQDTLLSKNKQTKKLSSKIYWIGMYLEKVNTFTVMNINAY